MTANILNSGIIWGNCITGNNNYVICINIMSEELNKAIVTLANSQAMLAGSISEAIKKRAEADLIKAITDQKCAENYSKELTIREKEADNNKLLIEGLHDTLIKINNRLDK